ncbi:hypothetical protein ABH926_004105 [Catenulispora sp. GP43]|uniref:hypothetical protein n=1 Tax=Catenulispora sp. GP43 TaxID=3156263 RepID=UPI003517525E
MTHEGGFDERLDGGRGVAGARDGRGEIEDLEDLDDLEDFDGLDERVRELLMAAIPDFSVTPALGDRAMAGAARRRAVARALAGAGAVAVIAVAALAVVPLAGWGGGHVSGVADARIAPGAYAASTTAAPSAPTATSSPSASTGAPLTPPPTPLMPPPATLSRSATPVTDPSWWNAPKEKAVDRVQNALQSSHQNSFMGVGLTGQDYTNGGFDAASVYDASPIVVYRKPYTDSSLAAAAISAAAPFKVVFQDTVLDASEQWFLGHRLEQDTDYWKNQGVVFATSLQSNGTITIFASDPGTVVPLLEQHYGYNGQVFVGRTFPFQSAGN